MTFNAMAEHYEGITVCGKPALFTSIRIKRDTVPDGLYTYDVRHDDECRGIPCEIAPYVMVNHWGTIILAKPLELPDDGRRYIDEETDWDYSPLEGKGTADHDTSTGQMVIALLACGVRIYELLHFKHEDFHRTESGAYLIGGCKTEAGRNRIIPILDFGIPIFEHAYATSVENSPLFPNGKGGFWNEKNWRNRKFYPFLEEIGIQPNPYDENGKRKPEFSGKLATYTPYTTRHTYASLCDRAGVNKDILKRAVGHTPKSKTLDEVYLHPKANQMIEAFDKANQLVKDEVLALPEE